MDGTGGDSRIHTIVSLFACYVYRRTWGMLLLHLLSIEIIHIVYRAQPGLNLAQWFAGLWDITLVDQS